jgi:pimeloyl-ACP methyl ester carboxylesterase
MMARLHCIRALLLSAFVASSAGAQQPTPQTGRSTFLMLLRNVQVGTEQVSLLRVAGGWTIASTGRIGAPLDLVTRSLEIRYDDDWKPIGLSLDATNRGQAMTLRIAVMGTTAETHSSTTGKATDAMHTIDPSAVLLPNPFFAAYEAVTIRLRSTAAGSVIPVYQGGPNPVTIHVGESRVDQIQTAARLIAARLTHFTLTAAGETDAEADIWADETGRLLRFSVPSQMVEFVREDIAAVSTRHVPISRANDHQVRVPANGFVLAGTVSTPAGEAGRRSPAVILVGGSGPTDREETVAGIPVMGQLAGELADAGFLVVRYDKRGIGQSGGRAETAGLSDFAEDLVAVVKAVSARKDVDPKQIAVVGHSEGGSTALLAAAEERRIAAVVLLATPGVIGSDLILAQQKHLLDRTTLSEADKQAKIDLQKRIHEAVLTSKGWEALPAEVRRQVDNAEFQSILTNDPAKVIPQVRQPLLIVQGSLDTQVDPSNADQLEALAHRRRHPAPVEVVRIPDVNHLFVPAKTGEVEEYASLDPKQVTPALAAAIAQWLQKTLAAPAR